MINRANCNLKLSKPKLLTALAWRGSYLSHNSIFKEQQSVSTQNFDAQTSNLISHLGNKKPSADLLLSNSAAQIRVLGCGDYLNRTDCQLGFCLSVSVALSAKDAQTIRSDFTRKTFLNFFLGVFNPMKSADLNTSPLFVEKILCHSWILYASHLLHLGGVKHFAVSPHESLQLSLINEYALFVCTQNERSRASTLSIEKFSCFFYLWIRVNNQTSLIRSLIPLLCNGIKWH